MPRYTPLVAPAASLLELDEVKLHLRVDHDDEDSLIAGQIAAATQYLDGPAGVLGRALVSQQWRIDWPAIPSTRSLELPLAPLVGVQDVSVLVDGSPVAIDPGDYRVLAGEFPVIHFAENLPWPAADTAPDALQVSATFGTDAADVPSTLRIAALLMVAHFYENRAAVAGQAMTTVPMSVSALIAPWRRALFT